MLLDSFKFAINAFTSSGLFKSVFLLICLKLDAIDFRTLEDKEIFIDHVIVIDPSGTQRVISGKELNETEKSNNFNLSNQIKCDIDFKNKPTLRQLFIKK